MYVHHDPYEKHKNIITKCTFTWDIRHVVIGVICSGLDKIVSYGNNIKEIPCVMCYIYWLYNEFVSYNIIYTRIRKTWCAMYCAHGNKRKKSSISILLLNNTPDSVY